MSIAIFFLVCAIIFLETAIRSPDGYEDEDGFRYGTEPED